MRLIISRYTTVKQVKDKFTAGFRNLKIEFYKSSHGVQCTSVPAPPVPNDSYLWEVNENMMEGTVDIQPNMQVLEFEQNMQRLFGLPVQVFRKMGSVWIETVSTDEVSLERLNKLAEPSFKIFRFNEHTLFL